ncbi:sigma-70 family RNA polymerase sigma factor [Streptomyces sp. NPDC006333]|uniref:sigma-70 family RNA polymerase sigma factor n=1 Tax=Streptomyces sp. NPDC006333 TaxID=3156753 RepID=UPI0033B72DFC
MTLSPSWAARKVSLPKRSCAQCFCRPRNAATTWPSPTGSAHGRGSFGAGLADRGRARRHPNSVCQASIPLIKRFFRDTSWPVHVPRRLQEARIQLAKATEELRSRLGRTPTVSNGYNSSSLDVATGSGDDGEVALADFIGADDHALELVEDFHALAPLIAGLDERERRIIHMRFVDELTQAQIGEHLGVSQMHISRLLNSTLAKLRAGMLSTR